MAALLWIVAVIPVIAGAVSLLRAQVMAAIVLIVGGLLVGPRDVSVSGR
jgi:hypothetical protein